MEILAFMLLTGFIGIIIFMNSAYRAAKKDARNDPHVLPQLGVQKHSPEFVQQMTALIAHLDRSFSPNYLVQVKERVMSHQKISETEWENRWFEWKRYLVLVALWKNVPMFSREVDDVWHEMLMFTREYEEFSQKFLGTTLHHAPHSPNTPFQPEERALFDLMYVLLFKTTAYSTLTWGAFLRYPLSEAWLKEWAEKSSDELANQYLNTHAENPAITAVQQWLVQEMKANLSQLNEHVQQHGNELSGFMGHYSLVADEDYHLWLLDGVLFLSLYHHEQFYEQHRLLIRSEANAKFRRMAKDIYYPMIGSGAGSDSGHGGGSTHSHHSHGSGHDSGGHSGHSCGGHGCSGGH